MYYLDLDVLETKCYIGSPKPWKRCDVRPFMETVRDTHIVYSRNKTGHFDYTCEDPER